MAELLHLLGALKVAKRKCGRFFLAGQFCIFFGGGGSVWMKHDLLMGYVSSLSKDWGRTKTASNTKEREEYHGNYNLHNIPPSNVCKKTCRGTITRNCLFVHWLWNEISCGKYHGPGLAK